MAEGGMRRPTLTVAETARITGWSVKRTRKAIRTGALPSVEVGSRSYVITAKLEELLQIEIPDEFFEEKSSEA
jgi:hypothetical protein